MIASTLRHHGGGQREERQQNQERFGVHLSVVSPI